MSTPTANATNSGNFNDWVLRVQALNAQLQQCCAGNSWLAMPELIDERQHYLELMACTDLSADELKRRTDLFQLTLTLDVPMRTQVEQARVDLLREASLLQQQFSAAQHYHATAKI